METYEPLPEEPTTEPETEETTEDVSETSSEDTSLESTEETTEETSADEAVAYTETAESTGEVFTEERAQMLDTFIIIVIMAIVFAFVVFSFKAVYRLLRIFF